MFVCFFNNREKRKYHYNELLYNITHNTQSVIKTESPITLCPQGVNTTSDMISLKTDDLKKLLVAREIPQLHKNGTLRNKQYDCK